MKFDIWIFSEICEEHLSLVKICQEKRLLYVKTYVHLLSYIAEFFVEWEMFQTNDIQKIKTRISCSIIFSRKSFPVWHDMEAYRIDGQVTDNKIIRRMRFACWMTMATNTHSEYVILTAFPLQPCLHELASILRYTYIACLVFFCQFTRQSFLSVSCEQLVLSAWQ